MSVHGQNEKRLENAVRGNKNLAVMEKNMKHVVIDMGSSRISVMAAEVLDNGQVRILSEESKRSEEVKYGFVEQPSKAAFTINELTRLLQNSARLGEIKRLCVSVNAKTMRQVPLRITRSLGFGRVVTRSLVDEMDEECYARINQPNVEIYDVIPMYYELDGTRTDDPIGRKGAELAGVYNLIVGNADIKTELERCFARTGNVVLDDFMPLGVEALAQVLLDDEEREAGCALVNFGATTTTLALYAESSLQRLLVVPLGGKNITWDIRELGISEANAERLKCLKGSALKSMVTAPVRIQIPSSEAGASPVKVDTDFLATIIEMRLTEMMQPIFKELQETPFSLKAGIVLSGGGSKLQALAEFMEEKTGLPVRFGDHSAWLSDDTDERFSDPAYAQSVGTVLLLHDYLEENPMKMTAANTEKEADKTKKSNTRGTFFEKTKTLMLRFFEDDNYLK